MSKEKRKGRWLFFGKDKYTYDTIDELVNKSMGLAVGEVVTLNGYYSADDGATHKRVISDSNDGSGVQLRSGKWANICENTISLKMLGCRKNNIVHEKLNKLFKITRFLNVVIDDSYLINNQINISSNKKIIFTPNSSIKLEQQTSKVSVVCFNLFNVENVYIENPVIIGDSEERAFELSEEWNHGIEIQSSRNIEIYNAKIINHYGDGIYIGTKYYESTLRESENIKIFSPYIYNCGRNGISICGCLNTKIYNAYIEKVDKWAPKSCIDIEPENATINDLKIDIEFIGSLTLKNDNNAGLKIYNSSTSKDINVFFDNVTFLECLGNIEIYSENGNYYFNNIKTINTKDNPITISKFNSDSNLYIKNLTCINPATLYSSLSDYNSILFFNKEIKKGKIQIDEIECDIQKNDNSMFFIRCLTAEENLSAEKKVFINKLKTNKYIDIWFNSEKYIHINEYIFTNQKAREDEFIAVIGATNYGFPVHPIITDKNTSPTPTIYVGASYIKDFENSVTNASSKTVFIRPAYDTTPAEFFESVPIEIKPGGNIKFVYSSIDNKIHTTYKYEIPVMTVQLNTPYMATKMQQEGVYDDFIMYMDDKVAYDKEQRKLEEQRQLAYQKALEVNPELTYDEWLSQQPALLPYVEEPRPTSALQKFMDKYL